MSNLANKVESLIKEAFPHLNYDKEKYILFRGQRLFFDFTLPSLNVYVEVQGNQHYSFVPFFHGDVSNFRSQVYRDQLKQEWCAVNKIILVTFSYKEVEKLTVDRFRNKILKAVKDYISGH